MSSFGFAVPGPPIEPMASAIIAESPGGRRHRYWLARHWAAAPPLIWILINPSTADAAKDDPTARVCMGRARRANCGGIIIVNAYSLMETDPEKMLLDPARVGPEADVHLRRALLVAKLQGAPVICGWGGSIEPARSQTVRQMIRDMGITPLCLGVTKSGEPRHPLRIGYDYAPHPFLD